MNRRRFGRALLATGYAGISGCLTNSNSEPSPAPRVSVTVVNRMNGAFTVDVGILEPDQPFEDGITWRITFGIGDDSVEIVEDEVPESASRIVIRSPDFDEEAYEYEWSRENCIELGLKVEVGDDGFRETARSCRNPQDLQ